MNGCPKFFRAHGSHPQKNGTASDALQEYVQDSINLAVSEAVPFFAQSLFIIPGCGQSPFSFLDMEWAVLPDKNNITAHLSHF